MFGFFKKRKLRRIAERRAVANKAIDWLEANPDRHITGTMSEDRNGFWIEPANERAYNFCALGRMANEAGITDERPIIALQKYFGDLGGGRFTDKIMSINDDFHGDRNYRLGQIREIINRPTVYENTEYEK